MNNKTLMKAENLTVKHGSKTILQEINWEIQEHEYWVMLGLNGCGKTTLLSILAGYQSATKGKNYLFEQEVTAENFIALRRKVGFVSGSFFDKYLSRENVLDLVVAGKFGTLGYQNNDVSEADVRKAKRLLTEFGLKALMRYPYDILSKGQQQRVLISRALMGNPQLLILDEPCSGLDILARAHFFHVIKQLAEKDQVAIVYVTHHTDEILPFFNKALCMRQGKIHSQGDMQSVFNNENLTDFFGHGVNVLYNKQQVVFQMDLDENDELRFCYQLDEKAGEQS